MQQEVLFEEEKHSEIGKVVVQLDKSEEDLALETTMKKIYGALVVLSLFFSVWLVYRYFYIKKTNRIILSQERKISALKHKQLQQEIETKEKELVSKVLQLAQDKEVLQEIVKEIEEAGQGALAQKIQKRVSPINQWKEFEDQFLKVHTTFFEALKKRAPTLTKRETQLCAFLKLNMSSKDMAGLTNLSLTYIEVTRSSIRKKLGLETKINLIGFLQELN